MKTVKNFTTTLPIPILDWLDKITKETKQNKNDIIEDSLKLWKKEYIQSRITESYKNAINDLEWVDLGNSNLKNWGEVENNKIKKLKPKKYA